MNLKQVLNHAIKLQQSGQSGEAETIYKKLLEQDNTNAPILSLYGRFLRLEQRLDEAFTVLGTARQLAPSSPQVLAELGFLSLARSDMSGAVASFKQLVAIKPDYADAHHNLGSAYQAIGDYPSAIRCFEAAIELKLDNVEEAYCNLGFALAQTGDTVGAVDCLNQVLASNPSDPRALFGLGIVDVIQGSFTQAIDKYRRVIAIDPSFAAAYQQLAFAKKFEDRQDPDLLQILACLNTSDISLEYREKVSYAAGKALDDCGDYATAITHFNTANDLKRKRLSGFDFSAHKKMVNVSIELFSQQFIDEHGQVDDSGMPLFVVGLPRSGTTLVEQILSSHSQIAAAGELDYFARVVLSDLAPYPEAVAKSGERLPIIARNYIELLSTHADGQAFVVDKYPLNFQYLGLLGILFPKARFIHCHRHPMDNALSIYFQDFATANLYANSIEDIQRFYEQYRRLMTHWGEVLGNRIFDIEYECLVSNTEDTITRLLDHIKLSFEPECLAHTQNKRVVQTLSSWQVRQPIYQSSKERWRNYQGLVAGLEGFAG